MKIQFVCRLGGASLVVPFVNYWWPSFPSSLADEGLKRLQVQDQWAFRVAHYAPWLFYWWMTQKWFPSLSILQGNMSIFSPKDREILKNLPETPDIGQVFASPYSLKQNPFYQILLFRFENK